MNRVLRTLAIGTALGTGAAFAAPAPAAPTTVPVLPATRPASPKPGAPEPLLSQDEIKGLFEQGKYPDVLRQLSRVMPLRGKAAEPYNKYELSLLKFETHMRMKASAPALATLNDAVTLTDDPGKIAYCKSVALLLKKAKNFQYQPMPQKKEKPSPIDIIDAESRKDALRAMHADELALIMPRVDKALDGQSLAGIAEALASLQGLDQIELAAGGSGEEAGRLVTELRSRGNALMAKAVIRLTTRVDQIAKDANEIQRTIVSVSNGFGGFTDQVRMRRRGLTFEDTRDLNEAVTTADQIIPNAKGLAKMTGGKVKEVEDLITAAEELKRKADKLLKTNYNE